MTMKVLKSKFLLLIYFLFFPDHIHVVTENHIFSTDITTVIPPQYAGVGMKKLCLKTA